jgi:hypothetical protein
MRTRFSIRLLWELWPSGLILLALGLLMLSMLPLAYGNSTLWHPDYATGRDRLHYGAYRKVKIPTTVDINTASYDELLTLPYVSSDVVVKVIRRRPFKSLQDLTRLSDVLPMKQIQLLQDKWLNDVRFTPSQAPNKNFLLPPDVTSGQNPSNYHLAI